MKKNEFIPLLVAAAIIAGIWFGWLQGFLQGLGVMP